ncbi:MAG TPA: type I methionyl aminopeptidase [Candidatus Acetothermia bacterium]|jgi:methionyl aminopeptidase|nr:type I methionyl aminopeptidase [Candidatus Bipolaricaulota bacterium]HDJ29489.1 type I methionyl aminopeptidase [Candidatus Acetothermia bacterium]
MILIKTPEEIETMRRNGALLASVLDEVCSKVAPGVSTASLDRLAEELIRREGASPAFKGYHGFPATLCTSINEEVVHGIPSEDRLLHEGDILSIDIGLVRDGYYADMATTVPVGQIGEVAEHLLSTTEESLWRGIKQVKIGNRLSDISHTIGSYVESEGLFVVKEYVGHGIGKDLHEDPQIPNYGPPGRGPRLRVGMVFAIEPMVKTDPAPTRVLDDGWTVVTGTGGLAAHFEHTVALTERGVEILTIRR